MWGQSHPRCPRSVPSCCPMHSSMTTYAHEHFSVLSVFSISIPQVSQSAAAEETPSPPKDKDVQAAKVPLYRYINYARPYFTAYPAHIAMRQYGDDAHIILFSDVKCNCVISNLIELGRQGRSIIFGRPPICHTGSTQQRQGQAKFQPP